MGNQEETLLLLEEAKERLDIEVQEAKRRCEFFEATDLTHIFSKVVDNCRALLQGKAIVHPSPLSGVFVSSSLLDHLPRGSSSSLDRQWVGSD